MKNYFYIKLKNAGYNVKTSPILSNYLSNFLPINMDEDKCNNSDIIDSILEKYNYPNNIIAFYQHKTYSHFKNYLTQYLNNKKNVKFKFYLFTFDFWNIKTRINFEPKNYKVFTFAKNTEQLDIFFKKKGHKKWNNNFIFKNVWCCYNQSILNINLNPIDKILISGAHNKNNYPERDLLHNLSKLDKNIISSGIGKNDIKSTDYIYNKRLNSYFACFSSSVYYHNKNTHIILLKTFEILGSGSLLVMPLKEEKYISEIGLFNMKNCYLIDFSKKLSPQIDFIFKNKVLFNTIRKNGQQHAINNLNQEKLIEEIKNIIES